MTPKEKAKELVDKFNLFSTGGYEIAKQCALIAVDEILDVGDQIVYDYYLKVKSELKTL